MWEPRCLTTLWAFTACYRGSFTFYYLCLGLLSDFQTKIATFSYLPQTFAVYFVVLDLITLIILEKSTKLRSSLCSMGWREKPRFHGLDLLATSVAYIFTSLSILVPRLCMLYHNFYCIFSCYLSSTKPVVILTWVVQWLRLVPLCKGSNSRCLPLTWGGKQIQLAKHCVLLFLEYRTMDKVQKPSNSEYPLIYESMLVVACVCG
jgi:hypothetical protein